jgi:hypothetical protein
MLVALFGRHAHRLEAATIDGRLVVAVVATFGCHAYRVEAATWATLVCRAAT